MPSTGALSDDHRLLAAVAATQLALGVTGLILAVRRRHPYDLPVLRGDPRRVGRDAVLMGTALSAPGPMLVAQTVLTLRLARSNDARAARGLSLLGMAMVGGYLIERLVRRRLRPGGWEPLETPVAALGLGLAAAMALLGRRQLR